MKSLKRHIQESFAVNESNFSYNTRGRTNETGSFDNITITMHDAEGHTSSSDFAKDIQSLQTKVRRSYPKPITIEGFESSDEEVVIVSAQIRGGKRYTITMENDGEVLVNGREIDPEYFNKHMWYGYSSTVVAFSEYMLNQVL